MVAWISLRQLQALTWQILAAPGSDGAAAAMKLGALRCFYHPNRIGLVDSFQDDVENNLCLCHHYHQIHLGFAWDSRLVDLSGVPMQNLMAFHKVDGKNDGAMIHKFQKTIQTTESPNIQAVPTMEL